MTSALSRYNNLTQRVIMALIGVTITGVSLVYSEWAYFGLFMLICALTQLEFYKLTGLDGMLPLKSYGTTMGLIIYAITFFIEKGMISYRYYYLIFPLTFGIFLIKLYKKTDKKPFTNIAITFLGVIYVAVPFSLLHVASYSLGKYSFQIVLGMLVILWASDSGAYFAGTLFGRRKLFERISPKKSWEGSIGGTIVALTIAYLISLYFQDLELWQWMIAAILIVVAGTYGDLVESLFKRSMAIKDSGTSIPGHGGFLDRFDGLLLSIPFFVAFLLIF